MRCGNNIHTRTDDEDAGQRQIPVRTPATVQWLWYGMVWWVSERFIHSFQTYCLPQIKKMQAVKRLVSSIEFVWPLVNTGKCSLDGILQVLVHHYHYHLESNSNIPSGCSSIVPIMHPRPQPHSPPILARIWYSLSAGGSGNESWMNHWIWSVLSMAETFSLSR